MFSIPTREDNLSSLDTYHKVGEPLFEVFERYLLVLFYLRVLAQLMISESRWVLYSLEKDTYIDFIRSGLTFESEDSSAKKFHFFVERHWHLLHCGLHLKNPYSPSILRIKGQ